MNEQERTVIYLMYRSYVRGYTTASSQYPGDSLIVAEYEFLKWVKYEGINLSRKELDELIESKIATKNI